MKRIQTLGLTLVAMLACSAVAASAASAHEFQINKETGAFKAKATTSQVFTFPAATVTCTEDTLSGSFSHFPVKTMILGAEYRNCSVAKWVGSTITMSAVEYEFLAEGGPTTAEVKLLKAFTITAKAPAGKCVMTIAAQGLKNVEYVNKSGVALGVNAKLTKITSSATGSLCTNYTNNTAGEFSGNNLLEVLNGGEIQYV